MKHESFDNLYFCLNSKFQLHLFPNGGIIFLRAQPNSRLEKEITYHLNITASKIVEKCDGKTTLRELICEIATKFYGDPETLIKDIVDFLIWGYETEILDVYSEPHPVEVVICGSTDFFLPMHLMVELTDSCNLYCRHCYRNSSSNKNNFLELNTLLRILHDFSHHGLKTIELTGGEPTLHPEFPAIIEYCAQHFDFISVLTNGYLLNDSLIDLIKTYRDKFVIQIDLDGPNPETHDWLRGKAGSFEKALNSIALVSKSDILCRVVMNVHADNVYYIEEVAELANRLGATWFSFSPILAVGRGGNLRLLSETQFKQCIELTKKLKESYLNFFFSIDESQIERLSDPKKNCGAGWRSQVLGPTGKLRPCVMLDERKFIFGDLSKTSCEDLFRSAKEVIDFFHQIQPPDYTICSNCQYFQFCAGCIVRPLLIIEKQQFYSCHWARYTKILHYLTDDNI
ncbi:PqqD family peptide modification chaperone [Thermodesulfovibrio yellowstonii]|uniref:PqqD family peptide modification chaperone n=1 Tax=Thermodesulfovibrio yellowstonii TaxID=28262 RepID=UPI003C7A430E